MTECQADKIELKAHGKREVTVDFNGGTISSDGGVVALRAVEDKFGIIRQFADCFTDGRDQRFVEHAVVELVGQRVLGLALGYEDLNDHDELRADPLLALGVGKTDVTGAARRHEQDKGKPLAGKSTLNRLELPVERPGDERYKKITVDTKKVEDLLAALFIQTWKGEKPQELILDLDATDDPLHGQQEGRFFHGYYDCYCYLPLYIFCGTALLWSELRTSGVDVNEGVVAVIERLVKRLRAAAPEVRIIVRGDSGFCRDELMSWCEANGVGFVLGLKGNNRLLAPLAEAMKQAEEQFKKTRMASRIFQELEYRTLDSWSQTRRVVAKAEHLDNGANPRFIVTSLPVTEMAGQPLYEEVYCARGDMENRIKEQQLSLFADRTSSYSARANQLRLWFSSIAYILLDTLRLFGLAGTAWAKAQCGTIRLKLLKIGAVVKVSVRRLVIGFSSAYPWKELWTQMMANLRAVPVVTG